MKTNIEQIEVNGIEYVRKDSVNESKPEGAEVIVRTYSAGVHIGILDQEWDGQHKVRLKNARRLWRWNGANTLNEVATNGVKRDESKISKPIQWVDLMPIEVLPISCDVDLSETWDD